MSRACGLVALRPFAPQRKHAVSATWTSPRRLDLGAKPVNEATSARPVPRQEFVDLAGRVLGDAGQDVGQPGLQIHVVHLCRNNNAEPDSHPPSALRPQLEVCVEVVLDPNARICLV
jgi:hypothetical protein